MGHHSITLALRLEHDSVAIRRIHGWPRKVIPLVDLLAMYCPINFSPTLGILAPYK